MIERERVTIERRKHGDVAHYEYDAVVLGEDEWGEWLAAPAGNEVRRGGVVLFRTDHLSVYLLPGGGEPWLVWFGADPRFDFDLYVDVGTPPVRSAGSIVMTDLDLDVIRRRDGSVAVLDEDELVQHAVDFAYPPALVDHARSVAAEVVALLESGVEPFVDVAAAWQRVAADLLGP